MRVRKRAVEFQLIVRGVSERRGSASQAATLYDETPESLRARADLALQRKAAPTFSFRKKGRPNKKERRALRRLKDEPHD